MPPRKGFYYRVNVVRIPIPPLRDRPEDIPPIIELLLGRLKLRLGIEVTEVSPEAAELLSRYAFPGNVRELENILERAFIRLKIRQASLIEPRDLPLELGSASEPAIETPAPESYGQLKEVEREMVREALKRTGGNKRRAAQQLGVTPQTVYNKIAEFQLGPES